MNPEKPFYVCYIIFFSFIFSFILNGQNSHLDNSFGINGSVIKNLSNAGNNIYDALIQPDGKLVVTGSNNNGYQTNNILARYNANGSSDNTFGNNGKVITQFSSSYNIAYSLGIQSDGKIITAGVVNNGFYNDIGIARYNSNGTLDNTFGTAGKVIFSLSGNIVTKKLAIQSDGKIVLAATSYLGIDADVMLLRFDSNGSIDNSFGNGGSVSIDIDNFSNDEAKCLVIHNNKIIVGANANSGFSSDCALLMFNSNGSLDFSFGNNGIATYDFSGMGMSDDIADLKITNSNKIIICGSTDIGNFNQDIFLSRLFQNGAIDNSFGIGGISIIDNASNNDQASSLAFLPNGNIAITGNTSSNIDTDYLTTKCDSIGNLITSFGNSGIVSTDFSGYYESSVKCIALNSGDIIVAGSANQKIGIAKYLNNGNSDIAFGNNGKIIDYVGNAMDEAEKILLQPDGKIISLIKILNGANYGVAVLRSANASGSDDLSFGNNGIFKFFIPNNDIEPKSMFIQQDGKIVITGIIKDELNGIYDFITIRVNSNGTLDNSFGTNGFVQTDYSFSSFDQANSVVVLNDGSILISGVAEFGFAMLKYDSNGMLDNNFGINGKVMTNIGSNYSYGTDMAIQSNGKIIVAGYTYNGTDNDIALVRYNTDGSIDNTFGTNGIVTHDILNISNTTRSIKIQADGKIVIAADNFDGTYNDMLLARYNSNGTIDNTFNTSGYVVSGLSNNDYANSLLIQSDGKIVVAGSSYSSSNRLQALLRYNTNGNIDNTFGSSGLITALVPTNSFIKSIVSDQTNSKIIALGEVVTDTEYDIVLTKYFEEAQVVNVNETQKDILIKVYPNPTNGEINLKLPNIVESLSLQLINNIGEMMFTENYYNINSVKLSTKFPSGIYILIAKIGDEESKVKILMD